MSQSVKEFVRQSGVNVQSPDSASNSNNNFARELEADMFRREREQAREARMRAAGFREPTRPELLQRPPPGLPAPRPSRFAQFENNNSPLENEFSDLNIDKLVNNALKEPINTSEFENMNPINEFTDNLEISPLKPGMFNATINRPFGKDPRLDLIPIMMKKPLGKTPIGEGLYIDTREMRGIYGQFKTGFSHTKEAGPKGNINKTFASVQIMMTVSNGTESQSATFNIYRNGKVRFSGGFVGTNITTQPELIRRFVVENYTQKQPFLYSPIEYNNLSGQFSINGIFSNLTRASMKFSKYGSVSYEPEITPMLYVTMNGYTLNISKSGTIQIIGAKSPAVMENAYKAISPLIREFYRDGDITLGVKAKPKRKTKAKKVSPKKTKAVVKRGVPLSNSQINALKLDGKKCERMDKKELKDLARKMNIVNLRIKTESGTRDMTKKEICEAIKGKSKAKTATMRNINKNKNVSLAGTNNTFRVGRKLCRDMKLDEIKRFAALLKINTNGKQTKDVLCKQIEKVRNNMTKPLPPAPSKRQVQQTKAKQVVDKKTEVKAKKVGIDENSIRKDLTKLYSKTWMNRYKPNLTQDIKNVKNAINKIGKQNRDKTIGLPKKMVVDKIKKQMVSNWKMQRKRELEKKYITNMVNTNGLSNNLKNEYRRMAANYMMNILNQKKQPTAKRMSEYKKRWLKTRANAMRNATPTKINRSVKARVEKM
jgi:TATA-box binding protein (TBP) (component of TFIID and TFIIIB)